MVLSSEGGLSVEQLLLLLVFSLDGLDKGLNDFEAVHNAKGDTAEGRRETLSGGAAD